jgi:hypothetical protein
MISPISNKVIVRLSLAALLLGAVACESTTSPMASPESAEFAKSDSPAAASSIAVSAPDISAGQTLKVTAVFSSGSVTVSGKKVSLSLDGGAPLTTATQRNGMTTWSLSGLAVGSHTVTVSFAGDNAYAASSTSASVNVNP